MLFRRGVPLVLVVLLMAGGMCTLRKLDLGASGPAVARKTLPPPEVHVLFHGIEPKTELRLSPEPGSRQTFDVVVRETATTRTMMESPSRVDWGATLTAEGRVVEVAADGRVHWRYRVEKARVTSDLSEGTFAPTDWAEAVRSVKGWRRDIWLDGRGYVLESTQRGGRKAQGSGVGLRQLLDRTLGEPTVHLPEEPVGKFAIWEVRRDAYDGEVVAHVVDRFELTDIDGGRLVMEMTDAATADEQVIAVGSCPDAGEAELLSYARQGGGEWTFQIEGAMGPSGNGWTKTDVSLQQMLLDAIAVGMEMEAEAELSITRR